MLNTPFTRASRVALLATMIIIAGVIGAHRAQAQPCTAITLNNFANCEINLCLQTTAGKICNFIPVTIPPTPGTTITIPGGATVTAAYDLFNQSHTIPDCTRMIEMAPGCCAEVCYDPVNCIITITRGPANC